ncbi:hypothetical protein AOQ84DRAFT_281672 [Glonium stellatum]|uniref:Protein LOT5 n=1 Tax=Glonium stellatum TaxID=574774 RepID=A0A8E2FBI8_9PEZI|nr:hypothetical protein AOQ84DRAFT_281672 [Glonium stellatum]
MALEILSTPPGLDSFTPLEEHQSQTPGTFFGGKPVLYCKHGGLTLSIARDQLEAHPAIAKFSVSASNQDPASISNVDVWVTSEHLIIFQQQPSNNGIAIPYPTIALHAIQRWKGPQSTALEEGIEALYMQLSLNDSELVNSDDDIEILEITVLPPNYDSPPTAESSNSATVTTTSYVRELFDAISACADLHPDPESPSSDLDDGEADMPGAGGWITSENMGEYFDEDGNIIGGGRLGAGAGTIRLREDDHDATNGSNGTGEIEGDVEETKWRRTE